MISMLERVFISLGGNVGDRYARLSLAIEAIANIEGVHLSKVSDFVETKPAGGPTNQGAFLNGAVEVATSLSAESMLLALNAIEAAAGRDRSIRWGPRTLDLDLLLFGQRVIHTRYLQIPHPRLAIRRFVLGPLASIAPEFVEPITGETIASLLSNLDRQPKTLALCGQDSFVLPRLLKEMDRANLAFEWSVMSFEKLGIEVFQQESQPTFMVLPREGCDVDEFPRRVPRVRLESTLPRACVEEILALMASAT